MSDSSGKGGSNDGTDPVAAIREEFERSYVDSVAARQRIADGAARLGITPDLLTGTGDLIYGIVVQQLLLGIRAARHAREIGARAVGAAAESAVSAQRRLLTTRVEGATAKPQELVIRNNTLVSGSVDAHVARNDLSENSPVKGISVYFGRDRLDSGRATSMRVEIEPADLVRPGAHKAWLGLIGVYLQSATDRQLIDIVDLEIWWDA